ncbi:MAG: caspase family protein [Hyphomicrobium sp.]
MRLGVDGVGQGPSAYRRVRGFGRLARMLLVLAFVSGASAGALSERRIALVVGNAAYATKPLDNPDNDADLMARTLRSVGFEVTLIIDADQPAMKRAIVEFGRLLRESDSVGLFYYAGHGVQVDGENYLIPVGADIRDQEEVALNGIALSELLKTMERAASRLNIAILDACRDNPFATSGREGVRGAGMRGLAPVAAPAGTLIAYATAPGQVALDGTAGNSPYSSALADSIPVAGLPLEEVLKRTRRKVLEVTGGKQTPWEHSSLTGEFYFRPKGAEAEATARPEPARPGAGGPSDVRISEVEDWQKIRMTTDPLILRQHIARYPDGLFSELVAWRLAQIEAGSSSWTPMITGSTGEEEAEDAAAIYERGLRLAGDRSSAPALAEAAAQYRRAAELGLPAAMHALARAYDKGFGLDRDLPAAAQWYGRASEAGYAPAMAALGTMHEFGEGAAVDIAAAFRLYSAAAALGDSAGMTSLAYLYAEGKGTPRNVAEARRWYAVAADKGQVRAMFNLALLLLRGEGGVVDLVGAVRQLQTAADLQHAGAMRELAYLYDEGRGVARNPKRAAELLLKAFAAGDSRARADILDRHETWSFTTRREIQRRLTDKGLYRGPAHGFFDARTRQALGRLVERG